MSAEDTFAALKAELKSAESAAAKALGALVGANRAFALAELALKHAMARKKPAAAAEAAEAASVEDKDD